MKKSSNSSIFIIALLGITILLLGILVGSVIKSPSPNNISVNPNIIVRDSTDLQSISSNYNKEATLLFEKSLEKTIDEEFDRTVNYLNFTIAIFAVFLTITLVAFGFFTIRKMSEAKDLLDKIIAAPDAVMKKYYSNQLNDLLPKLLSSDNREKSDAIHSIYYNTQLEEEKHFDLISNTLEREYQNSTSYTYLNVFNLFDLLSRLNFSKAVNKGFEIFEKYHSDSTMQYIVPRIMESNDKAHKQRFLNILCQNDNPNLVNDLIKNIDHFENFDNEMIVYISKNAPANITYRIINSINQKSKQSLDMKSLIFELDSKIFLNNYFHQLYNILKQNNQIETDIIIRLIDRIIENDDKNLAQFTNMIRTIINSNISSDEKLFIINSLKQKYNTDYDFDEIFERFETENNPHFTAIRDQLKT
ncbi:hypothetical protein [Christiangramia forsetii]|uniref:Membrane protein n=2 Tax=Christiangramia forsetii TaxID=411153 RepID=A0LZS4_CHRFK|nr:hypothetical protein [Christiangramia forsetii]GGG46628.1 hypothetical protein GCM10011532_33170 [Christiangramia forsetii]CAL65869.1 membrane protein [Christiangramia forsetii KT0803]